MLLEQGFLLGLSGLGIRLKLLVLFLELALLGVEGALGLGLLTVDVERLLFHAWVAVLGLSGRLQALHVLLGCHRTSHHWGLLHHRSHLRWHRGCGDWGLVDYWRSHLGRDRSWSKFLSCRLRNRNGLRLVSLRGRFNSRSRLYYGFDWCSWRGCYDRLCLLDKGHFLYCLLAG